MGEDRLPDFKEQIAQRTSAHTRSSPAKVIAEFVAGRRGATAVCRSAYAGRNTKSAGELPMIAPQARRLQVFPRPAVGGFQLTGALG
jgi:hypothetical protein